MSGAYSREPTPDRVKQTVGLMATPKIVTTNTALFSVQASEYFQALYLAERVLDRIPRLVG